MKKSILVSILLSFWMGIDAQIVPSLWKEYTETPDNHPNLPNCSYAGYRYGDNPLPSGGDRFFNVKDVQFGAKGDNKTDDTEAIRAAIKAAEDAGGGVVVIPAGTYVCSGVLFIGGDNVILRGEGNVAPTIRFTKSLWGGYAPNCTGTVSNPNQCNWSWCGGMLWITPKSKNTYLKEPVENLQPEWNGDPNLVYLTDKESWNIGEEITRVTSHEKRGEFSFSVKDASRLKAGDYVSLRYRNSEDWSLIHYLVGDGRWAKENNWNSGCANVGPAKLPWVDWVVQIKAVTGNTITLYQPLRIELRQDWEPRLMALGDIIKECGVENLTIELEKDYDSNYGDSNWRNSNHNREKGWNGIYINNAINCFVRNVTIYDAETSAGVAASKNVTFSDIRVFGKDRPRSTHHGLTCRRLSQDILYENFELNHFDRFDHGINVEDFSMGCVWHSGIVNGGCFDTHKMIPSECIRTNIKVDVKGWYGGGGEAGPQMGARFAHWNVEIKGNTAYTIANTELMPKGAVVGVIGSSASTNKASECRVEMNNVAVSPYDLYIEQKKLRNGLLQPGSLAAPWNIFTAPCHVEAEDAKLHNVNVRANSYDTDASPYLYGFSGTKKAEYDVNIPSSGLYRMTLRVCSDYREQNLLSVKENGVELGVVSFEGIGVEGSNWMSKSVSLLLDKGVHTLTLEGLAGNPSLNYFDLSDVEEISELPMPQFETPPGKYNTYANVKLAGEGDGTIYWRTDESGPFLTYKGDPIQLTETATIETFTRKGAQMSLHRFGQFEISPVPEAPVVIRSLDYTEQDGMNIEVKDDGNQLAVCAPDDWVDYYVDIPTSGLWSIGTRYSSRLRQEASTTGFEVIAPDGQSVAFPNLADLGGDFDRFKVLTATFNLKEGINRIRIRSLGKRINFYHLDIFRGNSVSLPGKINADEYMPSSSGIGLHRKINTSNGRSPGFEVSINTGSKYYYPVALDVTGTYPVSITTSNGGVGDAMIRMAETEEFLGSVHFEGSGGADKEFVGSSTVRLRRGEYDIQLGLVSGYEQYISSIVIGEPTEIDPTDEGYWKSGVEITEENGKIQLASDRSTITVSGYDHFSWNVYNINGQCCLRGQGKGLSVIDLGSLGSGFYIFVTDKKDSIKFIK